MCSLGDFSEPQYICIYMLAMSFLCFVRDVHILGVSVFSFIMYLGLVIYSLSLAGGEGGRYMRTVGLIGVFWPAMAS